MRRRVVTGLGAVAIGCATLAAWLLRPQVESIPQSPGDVGRRDGTESGASAPAPPDATRSVEPAPYVPPAAAPGEPIATPPFAPVSGTVVLQGSKRRVPSGTVELTYVDAAEGPVAGSTEEELRARQTFADATVQAGEFTLDLPVGSLLRHAELKPYAPGQPLLGGFLETECDLGDLVLPQEGVRLDLQAFEGYVVSGRILDAETLAPLAGAEVHSVWWNLSDSPYGAGTDADGRFRIGGLNPDVIPRAASIDLIAGCRGYAARRVEVPIDSAQPHRDGVEILLARGVTFTGRTVDREGQAGPGVELVLYREIADLEAATRIADFRKSVSDESGRFAFAPLVPGGPLLLEARWPDGPGQWLQVDPADAGHEILIVRPPTLSVAVQVLGHDGTPPPHYHVLLQPRQADLPRAVPRYHDTPAGDVLQVRADEIYDVVVVAPTADPRFDCEAGGAVLVPQSHVETALTVSVQPVPIEAPDLPAGRADSDFGAVFTVACGSSATGTSLAGCPVALLEASDRFRLQLAADAEGVVRFRLGGGRHFLRLRSPGFEELLLRVDAPAAGQCDVAWTLCPRTDR